MSKEKYIKARQENIKRRNEKILEEYNRLYHQERIRHDDCIQKLVDTFFLSEITITRILSKTY